MTYRRITAFVVATVVMVGLAAPDAGAQSAKQKKVEAARELTALRASDAQLANAVKTLDAQVKSADAQTESARQSVKAAQIALGEAQTRIARAEDAMKRLRSALVQRALEEYKQPAKYSMSRMGDAADIGELTRRRALLDHATRVDKDVLDQLHATRQDLERQRVAAARAKERAAARQKVVEARLRQLVRDRETQGRLTVALEKRIAEVQAEVVAISGDDRSVREILGSGASGGSVGKTSRFGLQWPVRGRLTSGFGRRWGRLHAGIDLAAPKGTPIHAAKAGTVAFAGRMNGYGNVVIISHDGGLSTLYGHQSRLGSRQGQRVSQGQTIGYVGSTGHSTGNHLHFETRISGRPQNPRNYLP
ncbi:MAG TPA: peptidoglycan DD-metalloendopeptidase family protein [Acidimicrobiales bacterium]|nr:peptidoglycan DD-metalloendopeptidase family protein [Acidimicrobiales bacterium]